MAETIYIESQQKAIASRKNNILLSASAGTGKTHTMVERILSLLKDGEDISSFLVLAFGDDPSKEMKERIEDSLISLSKEDAKFFPQLKKLKVASVSTINAFALEIAKTYFAVSGASPKAQIVSGADTDVLRATALEKVFLDRYEEKNADFLSLVEYFSHKRKDDILKDAIFKIYDLAKKMPEGDFERTFFDVFDSGKLKTIYIDCVKKKVKNMLESVVLPVPVLEVYEKQYNQTVDILNGILDAETPEDVLAIASVKFFTKVTPRNASDSEKIAIENFYVLSRKKVKDYLDKLKKTLASALETADFAKTYREISRKLFSLVHAFEDEYFALKSKKDLVDFTDTEHMLLKVLRDEKSRDELQARYKHIFCDEYQDVSKIQEEILTLISAKSNLFVVGDIKQSIYGFRACDQSIIKSRENNIEETGSGDLLRMNTNFRSHRDVLEFANSVFSVAMNSSEICEYEKTSMFEAMANFADTGGVEIAVAKKIEVAEQPRKDVYSVMADTGKPKEDSSAEWEGKYIASFIKRYLGKPFTFKDGVRNVKLSDFTILIRKVSGTFATTVARILESQNMPCIIESSKSTLKSHTKVLFLVDFLNAISSPFDDVPLYSTLVSPFFGYSDSTMLKIRNGKSEKTFHGCFFALAKDIAEKYQLPLYPFAEVAEVKDEFSPFDSAIENLKEALEIESLNTSKSQLQATDIFSVDFSSVLENENASEVEACIASFMCAHKKYRTLAVVSAASMLKTAIADCGVREKITLAHGETEWRYAVNFIEFLSGLSNSSLAFACEKVKKAIDTMQFSAMGIAPNAISIMTMHKSKGLEFPFTILAGTGKQYNDQDARNVIVLHKDYGMAFPMRDAETRVSKNTLEKLAITAISRRNNAEEELRLLYVAITRAKYKLLITGTLADDFTVEENLVDCVKIPKIRSQEDIYLLNSHLKVILASLEASKYKTNYTITRIADSDAAEEVEKVEFEKKSPLGSALAKRLIETENTNVSFPILPTKFTATQRLESFSKKVEEENLTALEKYEVSKIIDFATKKADVATDGKSESGEYSKTAMGTSYHKILEEIPFFLSEEQIEKFVSKMVLRGEILDIEYDIPKIFKLTNNEIFEGATPHREVPFVMNMQSEMFGLEKGHTLLCQGVIDCVFQKPNGGLIVLDYKATTIKNPDKLRAKYKPQLETYKIACETILKQKVEKCFIYSIFYEDMVEIEV